MKGNRAACGTLVLLTGLVGGALPHGAHAEERTVTNERIVGRVRVSEVTTESFLRARDISLALEARFAAEASGAGHFSRVLSVRPREQAEGGAPFEATIYDYALEKGFDLQLDAAGTELARRPLDLQPPLAESELRDAMAIVARDSLWVPGVDSGSYQLYAPMPPITTDAAGRRRVNVGILARFEGSVEILDNEIVSVHVPSREILRYGDGAPPSSLAAQAVCGPPSQGCSDMGGNCPAAYHLEWPSGNPVWKLDLLHPRCSIFVQADGTGLELQNVYYKNKLVFKTAHMPVLNVLYQNNVCGPYRDWLYAEDCFNATGTDVAPGVRVTSGGAAPSTFCQTGTDAGNFRGVAIHDEGDDLWLVTETNAGWYRYIMEWRLYMDGTIKPIFGFGATSNGCVCNAHYHHAYWRFEWALDGTPSDPSTGIATLERRRAGTTDTWDPVGTETKFIRPASNGIDDWWRVKNPQTGSMYLIQPGPNDGSAEGDAYGKGDVWALAYNTNQINDPNQNTSINIDPWVSGEAIGAAKRLVLWYHSEFTHIVSQQETQDPYLSEECHVVGPTIVFRTYHAHYGNHALVQDTCQFGGPGQGDGVWDAGEDVQFKLAVANDGGLTLTNVTATVVPTTPGVVMLDDSASYPSIPSGGSADSLDPHFRAKLPPDIACGTPISFQAMIQSAEGTWSDTFTQIAGSNGGSGCLMTSCLAPAVPPPVPDGTFGSPMQASRLTADGSQIHLSWDVASCLATDYHALYGSLAGVAGYVIDGSVCALGITGDYAWSGVPAGSLWFAVVGNNGSGTEGTWGFDGAGANRGGATPSNQCGNTLRDNGGSCQ